MHFGSRGHGLHDVKRWSKQVSTANDTSWLEIEVFKLFSTLNVPNLPKNWEHVVFFVVNQKNLCIFWSGKNFRQYGCLRVDIIDWSYYALKIQLERLDDSWLAWRGLRFLGRDTWKSRWILCRAFFEWCLFFSLLFACFRNDHTTKEMVLIKKGESWKYRFRTLSFLHNLHF